MKLYENILFPTDLTDVSEAAAVKVCALAEAIGAKITVLHVVDYVPPSWVAAELPEEFATEKVLVERAREHLASWANEHGLADVTQKVVTGAPRGCIVDTAAAEGCDVIVMGSHGEKGLARILGSTARGVLHDAPCDVLVMHAG